MNAPLPAVLLVEDDASIARFVALALEGLPLTLVSCTSAEQAQQLLQTQSFALLITDLMLPGASGVELIEWLRRSPQAGCCAVVFSAGVRADVALQLEQLKVWRVLLKPVSVAQLVDCVESVLQQHAPPPPPRQEAGTGEGADAQPDVRPDVQPDVQPEAPSDALAIANFFGGDAGLFHSYRDICLAHLPDDIARMEVLIAEQNAMALRRRAHSLQSVLRLLGQERASGLTRSLEQACLAGDWSGVTDVWRPLGAALQQLLESAGQRDLRD